MNVNVLCRNLNADRVIPRFSRYLRDNLGWTLTSKTEEDVDLVYLSGYFETQVLSSWPSVPVAAYFTHREENGSAKAQLFDKVAQKVDLRITTAKMYADYLSQFGPAVQVHPPVERDRFTIPKKQNSGKLIAGFCGFTYRTGRKGASLAQNVMNSAIGKEFEWKASGRGWPIKTKHFSWSQMPSFLQSLDILVCTSLIEGVPMPPLEALSCGVSVVIPKNVGLLDELPDTPGIIRYERGNGRSLIGALAYATRSRDDVDKQALRSVTEKFTVENWCLDHRKAFEEITNKVIAGIEETKVAIVNEVKVGEIPEPKERNTGSDKGIYCVAFGDPARKCAKKMMETAKQQMPNIPICLCSDKKIGLEDVLIQAPDSDIGGRRAKLRAYELAPAEWESVLYLDVDTEIKADISFYFDLIEDGWEFVICKDPHLRDTMHAFKRRNAHDEYVDLEKKIGTFHTLQYNGGVWAFGRNERTARFFSRWLKEWERYAQRDQGALIRAMYTEPLKVYLLGNEWNTFKKYAKNIESAGLYHYPGRARRWSGQIPGRIDSRAAWNAVEKWKNRHRGRRH